MCEKINAFLKMEPMKYYDRSEKGLSDNLKAKRDALIENKGDLFIATQKWDGYWGMFIKGDNNNEIFIRGRSKNVKGGYENYAEKLPHLVGEMKRWLPNTVVLAEMCWPELGRIATDVGRVLRCLPEKALARQEKEKIVARAFDVLMMNGKDLHSKPYIERLEYIKKFDQEGYRYFQSTEIYLNDFAFHASDIIARKGEGVVIQRKDNPYFIGKRPAWKTLKLKQRLPEVELLVVDTLKPEKYSQGDTPIEDWAYIECGRKLTKAYAKHWKAGVSVEYKGVIVKVASGITDEDGAYLSTTEAATLIKEGRLYAIVRAMQVNTLGSLRHPVLVGFRTK